MMNAPKARYHVDRIAADAARVGWSYSELARQAGVSPSAVTKFMRGESQAPQMVAKLAGALGKPVSRYFAGLRKVA